MDEDAKVRRAAALLIERDGPGALDVARSRAVRCAVSGDHEEANAWARIVEAIATMMKHAAELMRQHPEPREPHLDDVLEGADRVEREERRDELDRIIDEVSKKLHEK